MKKQQKESAAPVGSESDTGDGEFEPTAEMLVDAFDDERTLDEEEGMEEGSDQEEEIYNLQKEQDIPMDQLLAMYGGYPPEEGEGETEEQANGEGDTNQPATENDNDNSSEPVIIENDAEMENEVEDNDEPEIISSRSSTSEENVSHEKMGLRKSMQLCKKKEEVKLEPKPERKRREKTSELSSLYTDMDTNGDVVPTSSAAAISTPPVTTVSSRSLRCHKPVGILSTTGSRQQSEDEDDDDGDGSGEEEDWHKTIMIGSAYQAHVPDGLQRYGATPPYENEDKLLWEPGKLNSKQVQEGENLVEEYLRALNHPPPGSQGVAAIPLGKHVRDDEQALYLLLQCGYNVEEAIRRHRMNPTPLASTMTLWSEEECRNFENGLKTYGKDFHLIQQNKVRTRSVGELVQFYYLWKKTERHDLFAAKTRIEKKKYIVHPGTTDYMDRFLDEGDGVVSGGTTWRDNRSSSPSLHSLLYGRPPPGTNTISDTGGLNGSGGVASTQMSQAVQPHGAGDAIATAVGTNSEIDKSEVSYSGLSQMEDLARHLDNESIESLAKMNSSQNTIALAKMNSKRTENSRPMDVGFSNISHSAMLSAQALSVEVKNLPKAETVAQ